MSFIDHFQSTGYESGADTVGKRRRLEFQHPSSSSSSSWGGGRPTQKGFQESQKKALRWQLYTNFARMNCYERHHKLMEDYIKYYGGKMEDLEKQKPPKDVISDFDLLKEAYRFLPEPGELDDSSYEKRMAKKYYDKLYKEYCVGYLKHFKEGKIGMRWRTESEVVRGKGQFVCGNNSCDNTEDLKSYEVNFAYEEGGERKQALVKLRVCPECAYKLNYRKIKKLEKKLEKKSSKKKSKKKKVKKDKSGSSKKSKRKRRRSDDSENDGGDTTELASDM
mmetsp:Transcript_32210/g.44931  ORF Transcript_32210/g.44931 Transcript_32210/m.44931 type:complete len:278 (+) Transcript_32210:126-959(+)